MLRRAEPSRLPSAGLTRKRTRCQAGVVIPRALRRLSGITRCRCSGRASALAAAERRRGSGFLRVMLRQLSLHAKMIRLIEDVNAHLFAVCIFRYSDLDHKPHDRVAVRIGHPFGGADRIAPDQGDNHLGSAGKRQAVHGTANLSLHLHYIYNSHIDLSIHLHYIFRMKSTTIQIRLRPEEKQAFEDAAELAGIGLSSWVRQHLRLTAIRELESAGRSVPFVQRIPLRSESDG